MSKAHFPNSENPRKRWWYWVIYLSIFMLFLAVIAISIWNDVDPLFYLIASGLLWILGDTYPNRPSKW